MSEKLKTGTAGCRSIANQRHLPVRKENSDLRKVVEFRGIIPECAKQ